MPTTIPRPGMLARVRNRFAMIRSVQEQADVDNEVSRLVDVEYLDNNLPQDDQLLWELEVDPFVLESRTPPKIVETSPMPRRDFKAILRAAKWTALLPYQPIKAGARPVVAPLMGAVQVEDYQLVPLARALDMPRVQLGLFDDVGLGKTVEAGLLIAELIRRRRIRRVLILCPAWLRRQWQEELAAKFGLHFDFIDRQETQKLRREMGMDANPWRTFPRVIASFGYLRQPEVLQQFEAASRTDPQSPMLPWDLLIVDEVHNAMPASHGTDSDLCQVLQRISRLFEHRIFLSATPHPGFTRSYTGLLEMLDPVRITRSDTLTAAARDRAQKIVVRRLKDEINGSDLAVGRPKRFADRRIEEPLELDFGAEEKRLIDAVADFRKTLKTVLAPTGPAARTAGNFVLETLSKRLLSCPFTFADSWGRFRLGLFGEDQSDELEVQSAARSAVEEIDDDAESESRISLATELAGMWLKSMRLQEATATVDAALIGLGFDPASPNPERNPIKDARYEQLRKFIVDRLGGGTDWRSDERLIVFSEYRTTTDYVLRRLREDFPGEPLERFSTLYGGMTEVEREEVKKAFNDPRSAVKVLIATDAAGEGGNLQQSARLLIHFDLPWNPSRIDQRNGRLDRHGQARTVHIHHFSSEQDADLRFMSKLFAKIETRRADLGAVSKLFDQAYQKRFIQGEPDQTTLFELEENLEKAKSRLRADIPRDAEVGAELSDQFAAFREEIDLNPTSLRETLEVALGMGGSQFQFTDIAKKGRYRCPRALPPRISDLLRSTLGDPSGALPPIQFDIRDQMEQVGDRSVFRPDPGDSLMHLGHPLVQRCVAALAKTRFPGTPDSELVSRWVVTKGDVTAGAQADIYVSVEELALNDLRELIHHWVRTLRFPVKDGVLQEPVLELVPTELGVSEFRQGTLEAQQIWEQVELDIRESLKVRAGKVTSDLARHLGEDRKSALQEQRTVFRERESEIERQLAREISALREDLEQLRKDAELGLFDEAELRKIEPSSIQNVNAEIEARRQHYLPLLTYLRAENERLTSMTIPRRHALRDEVQVFPIAVEIRLRGDTH